MKGECTCFWCEKEIEYDYFKDVVVFEDFGYIDEINYDIIEHERVFCYHCEKYTDID